MKRPLSGSLCLLLFFGFASPRTQAQERLVLGYTNLQGAKMPLPLGKDAGIFSKHGLDLQLIRVSPGHTAIPKLLSGEIDLFLGNGGPVVEAIVAQGARLAIIASLGEDSFKLVTGSSIKKAEGLKGKRVGISNPGSSADRISRLALKALGLDPEQDVRIVTTGLNESRARLELLLKGEIDATIVNPENVIALGERKAAITSIAELEELGIYVSGADISLNRRLIEERREVLKRFLSALVEAIARAKQDLDLARRVYRHYAKVTEPAALEWRVREFVRNKIPDIPYPNIRALKAYLKEAGSVSQVDVTAVADFSLLEEVIEADRKDQKGP